jgi:methionine-rich copper-binding protein CopC/putative copper export protein
MRQRRLTYRFRSIHKRHPYSRLALVALSICAFLFFTWIDTASGESVAQAHAFVIGSDPVDGSTVNAVPKVVRIFFNTSIGPASIANVYTPDERIVDASHSAISGREARELDTPLITPGQLPQGSYTVRWTALANSDGHTTQGVIGFNVGRSSAGLPGEVILGPGTSNILPELNAIGILAVAWEWLVLMAVTFWVGILVVEGLILVGDERTASLFAAARKRAQPLQWLCLSALLVGEFITLILRTTQLTQGLNTGGIDIVALGHILFETNYGRLWLLRIVLVLIALGFLWWTTQPRGNRSRARQTRLTSSSFGQLRRRVTQDLGSPKIEASAGEHTTTASLSTQRYTFAWFLLAGLILLTYALTGDTIALAHTPISAVVLNWLYLAARCAWLGGFAYLGYALLPLLPVVEPERHSEILTILLQRFQPLMLGSLGVFLVSGLYLAETSLGNAQQLITEPYGRALLAEWILIAVMMLLSAYALFILRPKLTRQAMLLHVVNAELPARRARQTALDCMARDLKRAFSIQSLLGAGVLLCAAMMSFFAPPIVFPAINYSLSVNSTPSSTNSSALNTQTQEVGRLSITMQVLPGQIHYANTIIVSMKDRVTSSLITDADVTLSIDMVVMNMGTASASIKGGNPTYIAVFDQRAAFFMPGAWTIKLTIQRPNEAPVEGVFTVTIGASST